MLRSLKFFKRFKRFTPSEIPCQKTTEFTDDTCLHYAIRKVLPEASSEDASNYSLRLLLDSGIQLKPCPPISEPSLDELSAYRDVLDGEILHSSSSDSLESGNDN